MEYKNITEGVFIARPSRFVANVKIGEEVEKVHVKNTGQCERLLFEGARVFLEESSNTQRKTKYDMYAVFDESAGVINIDAYVINEVVHDYLKSEDKVLPSEDYLQDEYDYQDATFDYYFDDGERKVAMNVCGCMNQKYGIGIYPDTDNDKDIKKVHEITDAARNGHEAYLGFVIQINSVGFVIPNRENAPDYADALRDAIKAGVKLLFWECRVSEKEVRLHETHIIDSL